MLNEEYLEQWLAIHEQEIITTLLGIEPATRSGILKRFKALLVAYLIDMEAMND